MRKWILLPLVVLLAATLLAACGGGDDPKPTPAPAAAAAQPPAAQPAAQPVAQAAAAKGDAAKGGKTFAQTCVACHGQDGKGVKGLGKDLTTSKFVAGLSDDEMMAFIKKGRDPSDPLNTTGVAMPPKAGNPSLSDQDLLDVVTYIRTIHQ